MKDFLTFKLSEGGDLDILRRCIVGYHPQGHPYEGSILHVDFSPNSPRYLKFSSGSTSYAVKETVSEIREKLEVMR